MTRHAVARTSEIAIDKLWGFFTHLNMNRHELTIQSEQCLQELLRDYLPPQTPAHPLRETAGERDNLAALQYGVTINEQARQKSGATLC